MDQYTKNLQRQRKIEAGLLALLESRPFAKITVAELTEHLGMSRKGFYHYFPNKEACLESLMDHVIQDAALHVYTGLEARKSELHGYFLNLEFWMEQVAFLRAVEENKLEVLFFQRCMAHNLAEEKHLRTLMATASLAFDEDILYFCVSGQISLLLHWMRRGFDTPIEEMAQKYYRLMRAPLIVKE